MKDLLYEIDAVKYVLMEFDVPVTYKGERDLKKLCNKIVKYEGIEVSGKHYGGLFWRSKISIQFLIPASRAVEFSSTNLDDL